MFRRILFYSTAIALAAFAITSCFEKKKDHSTRDALLLLALTNSSSSSVLNPQQQQATTVSSAATGVAAAAVSTGNMTAHNEGLEQQRLIAGILENGNDPVYAREAFEKYFAAKKLQKVAASAELAAITGTVTSGKTGSGSVTYTFSGSTDGTGKKTTTYDYGLYFGIGSCPISYSTPDYSVKAGTATFAAGSTLVYSGSGAGTSFTGSSTMKTNITFAGFGTFYTDWATYATLIKNAQNSPTTTTTAGTMTCADLQKAFSDMVNVLYRYGIMNSGTLNAQVVTNYSGSSTGAGYSSNSSFSATLNSTDLSIKDGDASATAQTVILDNVVYSFKSTFSSTGSTFSSTGTGSLSITFSGKINGVSIDSSVSVTF